MRLLAIWDAATATWRSTTALLCGHSARYSATLPRSGTTRAGRLYELPTPALPTVAPASSSLPTPTARDWKGPNQRGDASCLHGALLPTPVADHSRGLAQPGTDYQSLPNAVMELLPTPTVMDMGANYTPEEWEAWKAKQRAAHQNGNGHGASLTQEAISLLPTPTSADGMGGHLTRGGSRSHELLLPGVAQSIGASTAPPSAAGRPSSGDPHPPPLFPAGTDDHDSTPLSWNG